MSDLPRDLPLADLERAYEILAAAIDSAGRDHEALFLAKLALTMANRMASAADFEACVQAALADLAPPAQ